MPKPQLLLPWKPSQKESGGPLPLSSLTIETQEGDRAAGGEAAGCQPPAGEWAAMQGVRDRSPTGNYASVEMTSLGTGMAGLDVPGDRLIIVS